MLIKTLPYNIYDHLLWWVAAFVWVVLFLLSMWIIVQLRNYRSREQRRQQIRSNWNTVIAGLLMDESVLDESFTLPQSLAVELNNRYVRSVVTTELVHTAGSLRGQMAETLVSLYNHLGLVAHSERLFRSRKWHRKAKGIQQVSAMGQHQFTDEILSLTNHPNTWVRNEAQLGLIRLSGTAGFDFLDDLHQPLSEWQQFNLLHLLHLQPPGEMPGIDRWLQSENHTVVVFAIRLCQSFQLFQHADLVGRLHNHPNPAVRTEAASCMQHWGLGDLLLQSIPHTEEAPKAA